MKVKPIIAGLIFSVFTSPLYADYDVADLKKLFTDKAQRAQIDAARSGNALTPGLQQTNKVKVSGYMTRSDGKDVVWLNNNNTLESSKVGDIKVHRSAIGINKKVTISMDGQTKRLKPGEVWEKETGKVIDSH